MSTRRGFLGLLAAAPIAAPAMAKELAASQFASGGFVRGVAGVGELQTLSLEVDTSTLRKSIDEFAANIRLGAPSTVWLGDQPAPEPWMIEHEDGHISLWFDPENEIHINVPNRLYGAEINKRGEAI